MSQNDPENCPHCKVSLLGETISQELLDTGYYYGTHWKREIGVEIPEKYDGIYYYFCPDCKGEWGGYRSLRESK